MKIGKEAAARLTAAGIEASEHERLTKVLNRATKAGYDKEAVLSIRSKRGAQATEVLEDFLALKRK